MKNSAGCERNSERLHCCHFFPSSEHKNQPPPINLVGMDIFVGLAEFREETTDALEELLMIGKYNGYKSTESKSADSPYLRADMNELFAERFWLIKGPAEGKKKA